MTEQELREAICEVGRRMFARNLVGATDGNVTVRLGEDRFLATPSGVSKGFMRPEELVVVDGAGNVTEGEGPVTTEIFTHLAAYEERPDIASVVHGHPPTATALTLVGIDMSEPIVPEVIMGLTAIPTTPYATPGSKEGAGVVRDLIREYDAVLLDRHGAVTVGRDPIHAYLKLEKVEHTAQTLWAAYSLGSPRKLDSCQIERLMRCQMRPDGSVPPFPDLDALRRRGPGKTE